MKLEHMLVFSLFVGALGHGALTKPLPRLVSGQQYCPWCVGEHQPVTNPSGVVNIDAEPTSPCLGSQIGDAPYPASNYNNYRVATAPAEPSYTAGGKLEANVVLDADHNGLAIFDYCPHSEAQTEDCFRSRQINDWTDVHAYWDASNQDDHWKSGQWFPQTVDLPADMPSGPVTLRWLWICKYTDEIFVSCADVNIVGGVATTTRLAGTTTTTTASSECIWTEPAGRTVERVSREEKDGRICWDVTVPSGTKVYYQSKTDIYHSWNSNACCLSAAESFGSDVTGNPNLVVFTPTANVGTFGFCECTAWDPNNPGTCAGAATADNMICPVLGASKEMCSEAASWDGLPVGCTPVFSTTPSATATTTMAVSTTSPTDGCCYWDANKGCEGSGYCWESKANCEGTCNGKWLANAPSTMAPTTVPPTTTVATTTAPVYTTTTTVTTTTTPMPTTTTTTTTMPSTTRASSDSFEPVDGGEGRACRGAHAGDNDASHFTTVSGGVGSLDECKAHCLATAGCHGIENIGRRCEIWTHPVGASISLDGYVCLRVVGGPVTTTASPTHPVHSSCGQLHDQCGGDMYTGSSCCVSGLRCEYKDSKYSQCVMDESSTQTCAQIWQQCGGAGWTGSECCVEGLTCVWGNEHYSQCLRLPGSLIEGTVQEVSVEKRTRLRKSRRAAALESRPWLVQRRAVTAKVKESEL